MVRASGVRKQYETNRLWGQKRKKPKRYKSSEVKPKKVQDHFRLHLQFRTRLFLRNQLHVPCFLHNDLPCNSTYSVMGGADRNDGGHKRKRFEFFL